MGELIGGLVGLLVLFLLGTDPAAAIMLSLGILAFCAVIWGIIYLLTEPIIVLCVGVIVFSVFYFFYSYKKAKPYTFTLERAVKLVKVRNQVYSQAKTLKKDLRAVQRESKELDREIQSFQALNKESDSQFERYCKEEINSKSPSADSASSSYDLNLVKKKIQEGPSDKFLAQNSQYSNIIAVNKELSDLLDKKFMVQANKPFDMVAIKLLSAAKQYQDGINIHISSINVMESSTELKRRQLKLNMLLSCLGDLLIEQERTELLEYQKKHQAFINEAEQILKS